MFPYHSVRLNFSSRCNDGSSKPIFLIFNSKCPHARLKNEALAANGHHWQQLGYGTSDKTPAVSGASGALNEKFIYNNDWFLKKKQICGIKLKLWNVYSVQGENSGIILFALIYIYPVSKSIIEEELCF